MVLATDSEVEALLTAESGMRTFYLDKYCNVYGEYYQVNIFYMDQEKTYVLVSRKTAERLVTLQGFIP